MSALDRVSPLDRVSALDRAGVRRRSATALAGIFAAAALAVVSVRPAGAGTEEDPDKPFGTPQYLIHITGHGTTSGDVKDDALIIFPNEPDEKGNFLVADGSGGTYGYGSDMHSGPYNRPSEVCAAAGFNGPDPDGYITSFSGSAPSVDCNSLYPTTTTEDTSGSGGSGSSPTSPTTPITDQAPVCNVRGQVIDAFGDPVPDIHIRLRAGALRFDTSTLDDGSYSFAEIGDNPGAGKFDSRVDQVRVSLLAEEQTHTPQRYVVFYRQKGVSLSPEPFLIPRDGDCNIDFDMRAIPSNYVSVGAPIDDWPSITQIYQGIHDAWALADQLGINMGYGLPLQVLAWCDAAGLGCSGNFGAFFVGSRSSGSIIVDRPYIAFAPANSAITSPNRPDNREYHEFGHYVLATAFNGNPERAAGDVNHSGYGNASSSDSWSEGFAEFWASMVEKYVVGRTDYDLYRWEGGTIDFSQAAPAWLDEETSVASMLVRLEALNLQPTPAPPRAQRTFKVKGYTEVNDKTFGRLIVGRVSNTTPNGTSFGTVAGAVFYDANRRPIDASYGTTIPPNIEGNGGEGLFVLLVPKGITYTDLAINVFEGRPRRPDPPGQPFDVTLPEIWAAITSYHSTKQISGGHVFDIDDLYQAIKAAFGGQGDIFEGLDTIDQLAVTSGFFDDSDGDFDYVNGDVIGPTSHPAFGDQDTCQQPRAGCSVARLPRTGYEGVDAFKATVSVLDPDQRAIPGAMVVAQVVVPAPNQDLSYGYVVEPDENGSVTLSVPAPDSGATVVLMAVADGHDPAVLGTIDPPTFWADAVTHTEPFLSFTATLQPGELSIPTGIGNGPVDTTTGAGGPTATGDTGDDSPPVSAIAILIAGLALAVVAGIVIGRRRGEQ